MNTKQQAMLLADQAVAWRANISRLFIFHSWALAAALSIRELDSIKRSVYFGSFFNDRFYWQFWHFIEEMIQPTVVPRRVSPNELNQMTQILHYAHHLNRCLILIALNPNGSPRFFLVWFSSAGSTPSDKGDFFNTVLKEKNPIARNMLYLLF